MVHIGTYMYVLERTCTYMSDIPDLAVVERQLLLLAAGPPPEGLHRSQKADPGGRLLDLANRIDNGRLHIFLQNAPLKRLAGPLRQLLPAPMLKCGALVGNSSSTDDF